MLVCLVVCLELVVCYLLWDLFVGVCNSVGIICTVLDIGCLLVALFTLYTCGLGFVCYFCVLLFRLDFVYLWLGALLV